MPNSFAASVSEAEELLRPVGVSVAPVRASDKDDAVVTLRTPWVGLADCVPAGRLTTSFVNDVLRSALTHGAVVITGDPHVAADGGLVLEDIAGIVRLDATDRTTLHGALLAIGDGDVDALVATIESVAGPVPDIDLWELTRNVHILRLRWSRLGLILALRDVASALRRAHSTSAAGFDAIADELTHRLSSCAWENSQPHSLRTREALFDLVSSSPA